MTLPAAKGGRVRLGYALLVAVLSGCAGQPTQPAAPSDAAASPAQAPSAQASPAAAAAATDESNPKYLKLGYKAERYQDGYVYCRVDAHVGTLLREKNCSTPQTLDKQEQAAKDILNSSRAIQGAQDPSASLPH